MANSSLPLNFLAQSVAEQAKQLDKLRQELKARQTHLSNLNRKRSQLEAQLQRVNKEIASVTGVAKPAAPAKPKASPAPKKAKKPVAKAKPGVSQSTSVAKKPAGKKSKKASGGLNRFLVQTVQRAGKPISYGELSESVVRAKIPTSSKNLRKLVQTKVALLIRKGVLKRAGEGMVSAGTSASKPATSAPAKNGTPAKAMAPAARPAAPSAGAGASGAAKPGATPLTLKQSIVDVLKRSNKPMPGDKIAARIKEMGYKTSSKNFGKNVSIQAGKMKSEIKLVPGQGYQLKK